MAVAAVLLAAGQQLFYSSLFALISEVAGEGPKDRPFAVAAMVRAACFGLGGLVAGGVLTSVGPAGYRIAVVADAASFTGCALLLALLVRIPAAGRAGGPSARDTPAAPAGYPPVWSNRPFLALIVVTGLVGLATDVYLSGISVYLLTELHAQPWLPGAVLALLTALVSVGTTTALRVTLRMARTTILALSAVLYIAWCAASLGAVLVRHAWLPPEVLGATLILAAASMLYQRVNALAEAAAPRAVRGRYLAAFQYAFTVPGVIAPAVVALFSVAIWLPWLLVAACAALAAVALRGLAGYLPARALRASGSL